MFNINEAITAYNYFCALTMSLISDNVNSWTERSKIIANDYEAECVRLEAECKEKLGSPYNMPISPITLSDSKNARYYIHLYIDKEHKFSGELHSLSPNIVNFRERVEGIAPVIAITIPEDLITLDIDANSFKDVDHMYNHLQSFYSLLFAYISPYSYKNQELANILSCLYLSKMTMFDIDKWTKYMIDKMTECMNTDTLPNHGFYADPEFKERKKAKKEFNLKCTIEEYKFLCETVKDMLEKYTLYNNPQIKCEDKFIEDFAVYLDYCKYRQKYRSYTIEEMIGPDPIPV